jgi:Ca2+-binding RTX toxin-like protein
MAIRIGTQGVDTVTGTASDDYLFGLQGDDTLYGRGGADILHGESGNDFLHGGGGDDTAVFDTSTDVIVDLGGYAYADSWGLGLDYLTGVENVTTGNGDDQITGNGSANVLKGRNGDNEIDGYSGDDVLLGGSGIDDLDGGPGDDLLSAAGGDDWLLGDAGDDVLVGGSGDDELNGDDWSSDAGPGVDLLTGGDGADTFAFHAGQSGVRLGQRDVVSDFSAAAGDKVRLHGFGDLEFVGTEAFSAADQVRYVQRAAVTFVQVSTEADAAVEMAIELTGSHALHAGDFFIF